MLSEKSETTPKTDILIWKLRRSKKKLNRAKSWGMGYQFSCRTEVHGFSKASCGLKKSLYILSVLVAVHVAHLSPFTQKWCERSADKWTRPANGIWNRVYVGIYIVYIFIYTVYENIETYHLHSSSLLLKACVQSIVLKGQGCTQITKTWRSTNVLLSLAIAKAWTSQPMLYSILHWVNRIDSCDQVLFVCFLSIKSWGKTLWTPR